MTPVILAVIGTGVASLAVLAPLILTLHTRTAADLRGGNIQLPNPRFTVASLFPLRMVVSWQYPRSLGVDYRRISRFRRRRLDAPARLCTSACCWPMCADNRGSAETRAQIS